jgi:DNA-binding LacI/PurR family transcriptional regulator
MTENPKSSGQRSATEKDVALLAGVSQSAVSRTFSAGKSVSKATRAKVIQAAESLGFSPNLMARALATRHSNIVALVIGHLENPFYAQVVKQLSEQLRKSGKHILLFTSDPDSHDNTSMDAVLSYKVDAVILAGVTATSKLAEKCKVSGVPVVQINRESKLAGVSSVRGENFKAGERIAQFLIAGGHTNFAFIGGTEASTVSSTRLDGFRKHLESHGFHNLMTAYGYNTNSGAATAARLLLGQDDRPDAIFCASDYMAFAVSDVARRELGLRVPEQVSIVGFDDVPEASSLSYDLTTYSQSAASLVEAALKQMDTLSINPSTRQRRIEVHGELIIRGSARLPIL